MTELKLKPRRLVTLLPGVALLSACAQLDLSKDLREVNQRTSSQTTTQIELKTLKLDGNVETAMLGNVSDPTQTLSAQQALQLGFSTSAQVQSKLAAYRQQTLQLAQQGRLLNPRFSLERSTKGMESELARLLSFSVMDLLSLPERRLWVQHALAEKQTQLVSDLIAHSLLIRQSWLQAIATEAEWNLLQDTARLYEAAAELAQAMRAAGNFSQQQADRFAAAEAEFKAQLWAARLRLTQSRAQLGALIGWPQQQLEQLKLPQNQQALPQQTVTLPSLNAGFMGQRLDVQSSALKLKQALSAANLAIPESLGELELSFRNERSKAPGAAPEYKRGIEVSLSLPVFNWGSELRQASVAASQAAAWQHQHVLQNAAYQAAQAYQEYLTYYQISQHYSQQIIPVRQRLAQQSLLRYNGMLISVFDLLDEVKLRLQAEINQQLHLLNFHLSELKLQAVIHGVNVAGLGDAASEVANKSNLSAGAVAAPHN